jgi:hypothetical protein
VLDKSVFADHFLEFGALDEVVIFAVDFMWTRVTGSIYRNANSQLGRLAPGRLWRLVFSVEPRRRESTNEKH